MSSCHHHLDRSAGTRPGPATADLYHEHEVILRALAVLECAGERLAAGAPVDEAALGELVQLIRTFVAPVSGLILHCGKCLDASLSSGRAPLRRETPENPAAWQWKKHPGFTGTRPISMTHEGS